MRFYDTVSLVVIQALESHKLLHNLDADSLCLWLLRTNYWQSCSTAVTICGG